MAERETSDWAIGWAGFAGFMLILAGLMQLLNGIAALFNDEFFVRLPNYTFRFDITAWGWIHLLLGIVLIASGFGILKGHVAGRIVGVFTASGVLVANFAWLPYYPVWSSIVIFMCIAVIWALTVHGRDIVGVP